MSWDALELFITLLVALNLVGGGIFVGMRFARRRQIKHVPPNASSDEEIMRLLEAVTSRLEILEQRADFSDRLISGAPLTTVNSQGPAPKAPVDVTAAANRSA